MGDLTTGVTMAIAVSESHLEKPVVQIKAYLTAGPLVAAMGDIIMGNKNYG